MCIEYWTSPFCWGRGFANQKKILDISFGVFFTAPSSWRFVILYLGCLWLHCGHGGGVCGNADIPSFLCVSFVFHWFFCFFFGICCIFVWMGNICIFLRMLCFLVCIFVLVCLGSPEVRLVVCCGLSLCLFSRKLCFHFERRQMNCF